MRTKRRFLFPLGWEITHVMDEEDKTKLRNTLSQEFNPDLNLDTKTTTTTYIIPPPKEIGRDIKAIINYLFGRTRCEFCGRRTMGKVTLNLRGNEGGDVLSVYLYYCKDHEKEASKRLVERVVEEIREIIKTEQTK